MTVFSIFIAATAALVLFEALSRGALTRRVWHEFIRLFILADLGALSLVRFVYPPRFIILGDCLRCGACCRQILAAPPRVIRDTWLLWPFLWYHRIFHNFHKVGRGPAGVIVLACGHLSQAGHCRVYRFRPLLCRNYPELPFFDQPRILPGCGFFTVPRVVTLMKNRPSLPIVNRFVAVHHPTPEEKGEPREEHFTLVDDSL